MSNIDIENSPGRSGSGRLRNYGAMNEGKLAGVIDELRRYGRDPEALAAAVNIAAMKGMSVKDDVVKAEAAMTALAPQPSYVPGTTLTVEEHEAAKAAALGDRIESLNWNTAKLPMKGKTAASVQVGDGWIMEPKLDGHRALIHVRADGARLYAGSGVDKTDRVPLIVQEATDLLPVGTWIDGEVVAGDGLASVDWGGVQSVLGSSTKLHVKHTEMRFVAFDLLAFDGHDMRGLALSDRREILASLFEGQDFLKMYLNPQYPATETGYEKLIEQGYEGVMLKRLASRYQPGRRSPDWLKVKATSTADAVIIGFEQGKSSFSSMIGAIVFGQLVDTAPDNKPPKYEMVERGKCSGMDMATRQKLTAEKDSYIGQVIEFAYMGRMPSGSYRHPQFKRFRPDKAAKDCIDEAK